MSIGAGGSGAEVGHSMPGHVDPAVRRSSSWRMGLTALYIALGLAGLGLVAFAVNGISWIAIHLPGPGWMLFGRATWDLYFLELGEYVCAALIAVGLAAVGLCLHLIRLVWVQDVAKSLPLPAEWPRRSRWLLGLFCVLMGAGMLLLALPTAGYNVLHADLLGLGIFLGVLGLLVPYQTSLYRTRSPRVEPTVVTSHASGTERGIRVAPSQRGPVIRLIIAVAVAIPGIVGTWALFAVLSGQEYVASDSDGAGKMLLAAPILLPCAVVMAWQEIAGWVHGRELVLTPTRLMHRTRLSRVDVAWKHVHRVRAFSEQAVELGVGVDVLATVEGKTNRKAKAAFLLNGQQTGMIEMQNFAIDPIRLYHLLARYQESVHARPALAVSSQREVSVLLEQLAPLSSNSATPSS